MTLLPGATIALDIGRALDYTPAVADATPDPSAQKVAPTTPQAESSFDLVLRARAGDQQAAEQLCARYLPRLRRWAHGRLPNSARNALDTQDLVQETLIHVLRQLPNFDPQHEAAF